jgi:Endoribonuclease L-PSP
VAEKRGLGKVVHAGREMVWGKGAVAGGFVFLSGAEARADDTDEPVEGIAAQTELALDRIKSRLEEAGARLDDVVRFVGTSPTARSRRSSTRPATAGSPATRPGSSKSARTPRPCSSSAWPSRTCWSRSTALPTSVAANESGSTGRFRRTHRQSRRVLTAASQATPRWA